VLLNTSYPPWAVWLFDLERGTLTRQTFDENRASAIWGPGPGNFTYLSGRGADSSVYVKGIGSGPETGELLIHGEYLPQSWSPDGQLLSALTEQPDEGGDIWVIHRDGTAEPFLQTRFYEGWAEFSPDGKWMLYVSNESGRFEVYARPFPGPGSSTQISAGGGHAPAWSRDGREIFFLGLDERLYSVEIRQTGERLVPEIPIALFTLPGGSGLGIRSGDVTPDGHFLQTADSDQAAYTAYRDALMPARISVVQNWFVELEEKLPGD
jgi:hypothetical protein